MALGAPSRALSRRKLAPKALSLLCRLRAAKRKAVATRCLTLRLLRLSTLPPVILVIALSKLLLVKVITIQRRLQSKEQFWPPVSFQAFGNGFFARYNPPMLEFGQLLAIALSGQERFDNG